MTPRSFSLRLLSRWASCKDFPSPAKHRRRSPDFLIRASTKDQDRLFELLPFKSLSFSALKDRKGSLHVISKAIGRSISTVSRELKRNNGQNQTYSATKAQKKYQNCRKNCKRTRLLENTELKDIVLRLFLGCQWSPEQIANRLVYEGSAFRISYSTIYRAIYARLLDTGQLSHGNRDVIRKLRHRGKTRRRKGTVETRGKIVISNRIQERPKEADGRQVIGHWEADTMAGKTGSVCPVTITDQCSRYLLAGKVFKRYSAPVTEKMIALLSVLPKKKRRTVTPDRGKEFSNHALVKKSLKLPFYFPDPHSPW